MLALALALAALPSALVAAPPASAPPRPSSGGGGLDCPTASEQGQRARDKNRYLEARDLFRACMRPGCPGVVRKDCTKWLAEIEEGLPSVVFAVQDPRGVDLLNVRVLLDGKLIASRLEGSSVTVDPGEHDLRLEPEGHAPVSQKLIVRVGEKNRLVRTALEAKGGPKDRGLAPAGPATGRASSSPAATDGAADARPATHGEGSSDPQGGGGIPTLSWVLGGVGVTALGGFAYFGLTGKNELAELRNTCAPGCAQSDLDAARTKMLVADVSLAVGVVALGAAIVIALTTGSPPPAKSAAVASPGVLYWP